jgi:hypothetical protein
LNWKAKWAGNIKNLSSKLSKSYCVLQSPDNITGLNILQNKALCSILSFVCVCVCVCTYVNMNMWIYRDTNNESYTNVVKKKMNKIQLQPKGVAAGSCDINHHNSYIMAHKFNYRGYH